MLLALPMKILWFYVFLIKKAHNYCTMITSNTEKTAMRRLIIILLIIGGLGFLFSKSFNQQPAPATVQNPAATTPATPVAGPDHATITNMALQSEAKAKQAAAIAATDPVAEYEKSQAEQP